MAKMGDQLPWNGSHYEQNEELEHPLFAERFPLPDEFLSGSGKNRRINLEKVSEHLPRVVRFLKNKRERVQEIENVERTNEFEKPKKISEYLKTKSSIVTLIYKSNKNEDEELEELEQYADTQSDEYGQRMLKLELKYVYWKLYLELEYQKYYLGKEKEFQRFVSKEGRMETQELKEIKERVKKQKSQFEEIVSGQVSDFKEFLEWKDRKYEVKQMIDRKDKEKYKRNLSKRYARYETEVTGLLKHVNSEYETRIQQIRRYLKIDCEYVLTMSLPPGKDEDLWSFIWNNHNETFDMEKVDKYLRPRWVFIPSCDRYNKPKINLNRCSNVDKNPKDKDTNGHNYTISILVVRPSQFAEYYKAVGTKCPIIQLPENVVGVGYTRYWIIKIAKHFKLGKIWMCDDTIAWFKKYKPRVINGKVYKDPSGSKKRNLIKDTFAFQRMESIMENNPDLAVICPRRQRGSLNITKEFTYKPPGGVCLINIDRINQFNLNYRPELLYMEDMIFALECKKANLQVCVWNAIVFLAKNFAGTGANIGYTRQD